MVTPAPDCYTFARHLHVREFFHTHGMEAVSPHDDFWEEAQERPACMHMALGVDLNGAMSNYLQLTLLVLLSSLLIA